MAPVRLIDPDATPPPYRQPEETVVRLTKEPNTKQTIVLIVSTVVTALAGFLGSMSTLETKKDAQAARDTIVQSVNAKLVPMQVDISAIKASITKLENPPKPIVTKKAKHVQ